MTQIGTIEIQTENNGIAAVPIFDTGDSGSNVYEMVRVQTDTGVGFIPIIQDESTASFPYLKVQTENYGICSVHNKRSLRGDKFWAVTGDSTDVLQYAANSQFDSSTVSYNNTISFNNIGEVKGITFNDDGTKVIVGSEVPPSVNVYASSYSLSKPFDLTSKSSISTNVILSTASTIRSVSTSYGGDKLLISDISDNVIHQYSFGTSYDISTLSYDGQTNFGRNSFDPRDIVVNPNFTKAYVPDNNGKIYQYTLSSQGTITNGGNIDINVEETGNLESCTWNNDGTKFYYHEEVSGVREVDCTTAYDLNNISRISTTPLKDDGGNNLYHIEDITWDVKI